MEVIHMRDLSKQFASRKIDIKSLLEYGFKHEEDYYIYQDKLLNGMFNMIVKIKINDYYKSYVLDESGEEYLLVDVESAVGKFVGTLKEEYVGKIDDIIKKCSKIDVFKSNQAKEILKYVKDNYNDELEYLWENMSNNAILRNKTTRKWYAVMIILEERKLNIDSCNIVEVIDLRYQKDDINRVIDNERVFPGYHMNKKSWITIKLDNSVDTKQILNLIDNSYNLSK